jgi:uncharacterized membrane protein YeaQ/YmgE (transglycosylase-associated protein family)
MHYLWVILIGFVAGLVARFIMPGDNEPSGFIMTTILGIAGSFLANFLAVKIGWASSSEGVSLLSGVVGAVVILFVYHLIASRSSSTI